MDAVMAFVQGTLSEEIYVQIPDGFKEYYQTNLESVVLRTANILNFI